MNYWGVDSYNRANHLVGVPARHRGDGPARQPLFDYVTRRIQAPAFWGRYLNGHGNTLMHDEAEYILNQTWSAPDEPGHVERCRILLVYNGPRRQPLIGPQAIQGGTNAARHAIQLARALHVPSGVCIYADLERWTVDPAWFQGWCATMYASEYDGMGGTYGNVSLDSRVERGWGRSAGTGTATAATGGSTWSTFISALATGTPAKTATHTIWANRPYLSVNRDPRPEDAIPGMFSPTRPPVTPETTLFMQTAIWQYRANVPLETPHPLVDFNLATQTGYSKMWGR